MKNLPSMKFCDEGSRLFTEHLRTCPQCSASIVGTLHFLTTEIPMIGWALKKAGVPNLKEVIARLQEGTPHASTEAGKE